MTKRFLSGADASAALAALIGFLMVLGSGLSAAYGVPLARSAPALLLVLLFFAGVTGRHELRRLTLFHASTLALFVLLVLGTLYTRSPLSGSFKALMVLLYWVLFSFAFFNVFTGVRHIETFLVGMGVGGLVYVALLWAFVGNPFALLAEASVFFRLVIGERQNPIWLGRVMGLAILLLVWFLTDRPIGKWSLLAIPALPLTAGYLVATGSKGPVIAAVVGAGTFALARGGVWARVAVIALLCVALVSVSVLMTSPSADEGAGVRLLRSAPASFAQRASSWRDAIGGFGGGGLLSLVFGRGTGDFSYLRKSVDVRDYPHNIFLEVLYEGGIVGSALLFCVVLAPIVASARLARTTRKAGDRRIVGITAVASAMYAFALVNAQVSGDLLSNEFVPITGVILVTLACAGSPEGTAVPSPDPAPA